MKAAKKIFTLILGIVSMIGMNVQAQTFETAVQYMEYMSQEHQKISDDSWDYIRSVTHGKSANKVDKRRQEMIQTISIAKKKISAMPGYNGSTSLRDSVVLFLDINYKVLNHDYAEIVDMEQIAEQSYDLMEAYLSAQEQASKKLKEASQMVNNEQTAFAKENNINIVQSESKTSKKIAEATEVMEYYNKIYLIFFKSYKQEGYLITALDAGDISAVQQNKNTLIKYAKEGMKALNLTRKYKDDDQIIVDCKKMLNFYIDEGEKKVPVLIDYNMKKDNFDKIKKAFDSKKDSERSQEDVDQYNKAAQDLNASGATYNDTNNKLNQERAKLIQMWNKSTGTFLDKHTAH